jgi:hypothetical protein
MEGDAGIMVRRLTDEISREHTQAFSGPIAAFVRVTLAVACMAGTLLALPSLAQDARSQAREACEADYRRFCTGIMPGGGRVRKCLDEHAAALSPRCKQIISAQTGK